MTKVLGYTLAGIAAAGTLCVAVYVQRPQGTATPASTPATPPAQTKPADCDTPAPGPTPPSKSKPVTTAVPPPPPALPGFDLTPPCAAGASEPPKKTPGG